MARFLFPTFLKVLISSIEVFISKAVFNKYSRRQSKEINDGTKSKAREANSGNTSGV